MLLETLSIFFLLKKQKFRFISQVTNINFKWIKDFKCKIDNNEAIQILTNSIIYRANFPKFDSNSRCKENKVHKFEDTIKNNCLQNQKQEPTGKFRRQLTIREKNIASKHLKPVKFRLKSPNSQQKKIDNS